MTYVCVADLPKFQGYVLSYVPIPNQVFLRTLFIHVFKKQNSYSHLKDEQNTLS